MLVFVSSVIMVLDKWWSEVSASCDRLLPLRAHAGWGGVELIYSFKFACVAAETVGFIMEFNFDQRSKSEKVELSRRNQTAVLRRPGRDDLGVVFSEQPVHVGQDFVVRIDNRNKEYGSFYIFVSGWMLVILSRPSLYTSSLQTGILSF